MNSLFGWVKPLIITTGIPAAQASHANPLDSPIKNAACFSQRARSTNGRSPVSSRASFGICVQLSPLPDLDAEPHIEQIRAVDEGALRLGLKQDIAGLEIRQPYPPVALRHHDPGPKIEIKGDATRALLRRYRRHRRIDRLRCRSLALSLLGLRWCRQRLWRDLGQDNRIAHEIPQHQDGPAKCGVAAGANHPTRGATKPKIPRLPNEGRDGRNRSKARSCGGSTDQRRIIAQLGPMNAPKHPARGNA